MAWWTHNADSDPPYVSDPDPYADPVVYDDGLPVDDTECGRDCVPTTDRPGWCTCGTTDPPLEPIPVARKFPWALLLIGAALVAAAKPKRRRKATK